MEGGIDRPTPTARHFLQLGDSTGSQGLVFCCNLWWTEWAPAWGYIPPTGRERRTPCDGASIYQGSFEQYHVPGEISSDLYRLSWVDI